MSEYFYVYKVINRPLFLVWWVISDMFPSMLKNCEIMARLVCNASLLKDNDYRLKKLPFIHKVCTQCYLGIREDVNHLLMQCPAYVDIKREMYGVLESIDHYIKVALDDQQGIFNTLMGRYAL